MQLTTDPHGDYVEDWSSDRAEIAFHYSFGVGGQVYVVSRPRRGAAFGTPRQLTQRSGTDRQWSPDGKWIAYVRDGIRVNSPDGT